VHAYLSSFPGNFIVQPKQGQESLP
jgi:hypothetical protein